MKYSNQVFIFSVLLFIDVTLSTCNEASDTEPFLLPIPNLDSAMEGYDPFNADPHVRPDPGVRNQIFEATRKLSNGQLVVNEFLDKAREDIHCDMEFFSRTIDSYTHFRAEKSESTDFSRDRSMEASVGVAGFDFGASMGRGKEKQESEQAFIEFYKKGQGEMMVVKAECITHSVSISSFYKPKFTPAFEEALRALHLAATRPGHEEDSEIFKNFVASYGTHFMKSAYLGSKLVFQKLFSNKSETFEAQQEREECMSRSVNRGLNAGWRENSVSTSFEKSSEECGDSAIGAEYKFYKTFSAIKIIAIGSLPPTDIHEWAEHAKASPTPIKFTLEKISFLFRPGWIDSISLDPEFPCKEYLNASAIYQYFEEKCAKYCEILQGEENCDFVNQGCGINSRCPLDTTCINVQNENYPSGYMCHKPYGNYKRNLHKKMYVVILIHNVQNNI